MKALPRCLLLILTSLGGCAVMPQPANPTTPALIPGDAGAPSQVTPTESLAIAQAYAKHPWQPYARNILHGNDPAGVRVDTPDADYKPADGRNGWWMPGLVNHGVPYKWGGFDDLGSFDEGIANGKAGGDVSSPAKRQADNAAVSSQAVGVDCSGFVSRCLKLPAVHDSAQLPAVCDPVASFQDLRPGDILNIPRRHVMLVAGWAKPDRSWVLYYETGGIPDWKPALKQAPTQALIDLGYQPLRYKGMAREAQPSGKEVLTRAVRAQAIVIANPVIGEP